MCTPETKASVWSIYLNAQYNALWKIAAECGDREEEKCRFYRALASYDYSAADETEAPHEGTPHHRISFREPQLIFLCNHSVILTLTVDQGTITAASSEDGEVPHELSLDGVQASFRMSFTRTHVTGRDTKIDDQAADHEVRMVVFDFEKASLLTPLDYAAETFFREYLTFLRRAGHHVLFGFPDFTDKKVLESLPVDYAILRQSEHFVLEDYSTNITYFNITTTQINEYIRHVQYEGAEARAQEKKEPLAASIARVRWAQDLESNVFLDIRFGVPEVKALCPHEALYIFKLDEIIEVERDQVLTGGYDVAFVVNVSEFDGKTLKIDFRTARFTETSSSIHYFESETLSWQSIVEYLSTQYMDILTKFNYNILFGPPEERRRAALKDGGFWRRVDNVTDYLAVRRYGESAIWIDRCQHVSLSGAYQAFALSERALDDIIRSKWLAGNYYQWATETFRVVFSSFSIRLMSNDHFLVVVEIEEAEVISGDLQSRQRPGKGPPLRIFQSRRGHAAAELQTRIEEEQRELYKGTMVFEVGLDFFPSDDGQQALSFEMILKHTEYIDNLSSLLDVKTGLRAGDGSQATVRRSIQQYFSFLADERAITIGTVLPRNEAQNFVFKTICEREVKVDNFLTTRSEASDSSVIVLCDLHTVELAPTFPWSPGWLPSSMRGGVGTIWISKEAFLKRLLDVLETFNAHTTIVRGGDDTFQTFDTRSATQEGREGKTGWQRESAGDLENEYMEYNWHYAYDANRREGTLHTQDLDALMLRTQNQVWVPTESSSSSNQVEVAITGEHHTEAARKAKYSHQLLKKDTAIWWELIVVISSSPESGLLVTVNHERHSVVEGDDSVEDTVHADSLLNLPDIVTRLEENLRATLSGPWVCNWLDLDPEVYECTHPVFTRSGDLVFEVYSTAHALGSGVLPGNGGDEFDATRLDSALRSASSTQVVYGGNTTVTRQTVTRSSSTLVQSAVQQSSSTRGSTTPMR